MRLKATTLKCLLLFITVQLLLSTFLFILHNGKRFIQSFKSPSASWKLNEETHVYEFQNKPPIWVYWDTLENQHLLPPHICLSLKTIYCHNHQDFTIKLVTRETFPHYVKNIHRVTRYFISAHRADYFRSRILEQYGGVYLDIDAVALQSLKTYYDHLKVYDIVTHSDYNEKISMGFLGPVRAGHLLFRQYTEKVHRLFDARYNGSNNITRDVFGWSEMGGRITIPTFHELLRLNLTNPIVYHGRSTVIQLVTHYDPLTQLNSSQTLLTKMNLTNTPLLYYHNSGVLPKVKQMYPTELSLLKSNTVLGYLFRIALENCTQIPTCEDLQKELA
ncbi:unnamed protein product [Rotaria socialis]|uniref:Uncharacterized protein n=2 Tax=Rotaria socialis TaxID=392032 RepID=A0A821M4C8_9BILA|nr:unnamed protein product [Rotaria socialis]CAF3589686.1 unnamed protein product [Rotaria socialis]CAF4458678.1 unnamed protein product [Rotaria socialis]CAF4498956.1 unnamed protein product [Rotaria socialis]CAF4660630.1 unnamed protein product [Rotaria socialis]